MPKKKKPPQKIKKKKKNGLVRSFFIKTTGLSFLLGAALLVVYVFYLDKVIREKFDGNRWSLPAIVYARPLELYPGLPFSPEMLEKELQLGGYRQEETAVYPGSYDKNNNLISLVTRDFNFPEGLQKSQPLSVQFSSGSIRSITQAKTGENLSLARLDPARIGSFHPKRHEDRILLKHDELPDMLVKTILTVEDQSFYRHFGLSPLSIGRALFVNMKAGKTVQGGSTITQQLVKNFFLSNKRTFYRKFNEAIMALLLEGHYSKDEILTAYINEVYLGQDGGRAIHGFGLASQFYFRRDINNLSAAQTALLVGMVKGPSYYNPTKYPERAGKRRDIVLDLMLAESLIDNQAYQKAKQTSLNETKSSASGFNRFPAFLDLVRRQLKNDYKEADLTSTGFQILTTLDPQIQWQVERNLEESLAGLEQKMSSKNLEGAVIVSSREGGEILALSGGRKPLHSSFNRAIDARRQIGSLVKPAVFLTALEQGYTLASPVQDKSITITKNVDKPWTPKNFDNKEHGNVMLLDALAHSYNLATVATGMDVGLDTTIRTVKHLGVENSFSAYPSFLLGAAAMTPIEVSQMFQTYAAGGFFVPQRVIGSVLDADHKTLKRFGLSVEQRFKPESVFMVNYAMQHAVREGTGKSLSRYLPANYNIAGKTGTSNDLRDSWFAGFTGDKLAVVWLGRDDNGPIGLTGAKGALPVWGKIMQNTHTAPLDLVEPPGIEWAWINRQTFQASSRFNQNSIRLPFTPGSSPGHFIEQANEIGQEKITGTRILKKIRNWFR